MSKIKIITLLVLFIGCIAATAYVGSAIMTYYTPVKQYDDVINYDLDDLLHDIPTAIIARVGLIHTTPHSVSDSQQPMLLWDIVYARAAPTYKPGPGALVHDQSLASWATWIKAFDKLVNGQCKYLIVDQLPEAESREHLTELGVESYIVCPIVGHLNGKLQGALMVSWHETPIKPDDYIPRILLTAHQISLNITEISHD
jgi:hypothetical protein